MTIMTIDEYRQSELLDAKNRYQMALADITEQYQEEQQQYARQREQQLVNCAHRQGIVISDSNLNPE